LEQIPCRYSNEQFTSLSDRWPNETNGLRLLSDAAAVAPIDYNETTSAGAQPNAGDRACYAEEINKNCVALGE
jgi:hypothetical protein